jgi:hypothetical protein
MYLVALEEAYVHPEKRNLQTSRVQNNNNMYGSKRI